MKHQPTTYTVQAMSHAGPYGANGDRLHRTNYGSRLTLVEARFILGSSPGWIYQSGPDGRPLNDVNHAVVKVR